MHNVINIVEEGITHFITLTEFTIHQRFHQKDTQIASTENCQFCKARNNDRDNNNNLPNCYVVCEKLPKNLLGNQEMEID